MKVTELIKKLQKWRSRYIEKHGVEPSIFEYCPDEGLLLCAKVEKKPGLRTAKKPYMRIKTKFPWVF